MAEREQSAIVDLKVRMKEALRVQIEAAATRRGVSMNAEAVVRLEDSFKTERLLPEVLTLAYGPETGSMLLLLGYCMRSVSFLASTLTDEPLSRLESWAEDPWIFGQVEQSVQKIFDALRPTGDSAAPKESAFAHLGRPREELYGGPVAEIGKRLADGAIALVRDPRSANDLDPMLEPIHRRLRSSRRRGKENRYAR